MIEISTVFNIFSKFYVLVNVIEIIVIDSVVFCNSDLTSVEHVYTVVSGNEQFKNV